MTIEALLSIIAGIIGTIGSACLLATFFLFPKLRDYGTVKVFFMAFCDLPLGLVMSPLTGPFCVFTAMLTNFFLVATCSWNVLIAYDLHRVLNGKGSPKVISLKNHLFCWVPSLVAAIWPLTTQSYGDPVGEDWQDCWYKDRTDISKLALLIPICLYLCFTVYLLIEYWIRHANALVDRSVQNALTQHTLKFSLVFIFLWSWFVMSCLEDLWIGSRRFQFVDDVAFYCFKCNGFANCVIWISSPVFRSARREKRRLQSENAGASPPVDERPTFTNGDPLRRSLLTHGATSEDPGTDPSDPPLPTHDTGEICLLHTGSHLSEEHKSIDNHNRSNDNVTTSSSGLSSGLTHVPHSVIIPHSDHDLVSADRE